MSTLHRIGVEHADALMTALHRIGAKHADTLMTALHRIGAKHADTLMTALHRIGAKHADALMTALHRIGAEHADILTAFFRSMLEIHKRNCVKRAPHKMILTRMHSDHIEYVHSNKADSDSLYGARTIPRSVIIAVTYSLSVTSKAGLNTFTFSGAILS